MFHKPVSTDAREDRNHLIQALGREAYLEHVWITREQAWLTKQGLSQIPRSSSAWRGVQINAAAKIACYAIGLGLRYLFDTQVSSSEATPKASVAMAQILNLPRK